MLLLMGFLYTSCMPVIKMIYGVHQPGYVSNDDVIRYYHHLGLKDEIYRLINYSEENRGKFRYLGNSIPEILIFNSSGQLTKFEVSCSSSNDSIIKLTPDEIDNINISEEGKTLQDLIGDTYKVNALNQGDITQVGKPLYVVKFAEFAGLLNKNNVPGVVKQLALREDVQYIVLNMDYTVTRQ